MKNGQKVTLPSGRQGKVVQLGNKVTIVNVKGDLFAVATDNLRTVRS